jgi:hypothetical protein
MSWWPRQALLAHRQCVSGAILENARGRSNVRGHRTTTALTIHRNPLLLTATLRRERALSRSCPRLRIWAPPRRSSVSSMLLSMGASTGTTVSRRSGKKHRLAANGDQRARLSTWWDRLQCSVSCSPANRNALHTVRRPRARSVPVRKVISFFPVGAVNSGRNGATTFRRVSGRGMHFS